MADDKQHQEEEYFFSENEQPDSVNAGDSVFTPQSNTSEPTQASPLNRWRKNLIVGIGMFVVIFVVYKIISAFFTSEPAKSTTPVVQPKKVETTNLLPKSVNRTNNSLQQSVEAYNRNRLDGKRVEKLEMTFQRMNLEVDGLKNEMQGLQSSVSSMNAQLSQVNAALVVLTDKLQTQENRWIESQKKAKKTVKSVSSKLVVKPEVYNILAMVPGRAWLKSTRGSTITVGVGKEIPGYGHVINIDAQEGKVVMSSGAVIEYASSDL